MEPYLLDGVEQVWQARATQLEAGIGPALLGGDMDGGHEGAIQGVHAVPAGLEDEVVNGCTRQQGLDACGCRGVLG